MTVYRSGGQPTCTTLEMLFTGTGPMTQTEERSQATGVLVTSLGARHATVEWFVSITARTAAARAQTESLADDRAVLLHRTLRS
ncbi:hypothetical protein ABZ721_15195 [Streptomyces sp. NPDC006733]|uniref:hypothetical protein n=1 Tax=Streptomyces sp. NPDC006733 TaxID=3155460 RepID=UPI0033FC73ED